MSTEQSSKESGQLGQSPKETEPTSEVHDKRRLRGLRYGGERQYPGSKLFGGLFKVRTCVWQQIARASLEFLSQGPKPVNLRKFCELASFWHPVEVGMSHKTIADVDDGSGDFTPVCREYTLPRADPRSKVFGGKSRRNSNWASRGMSRRATSWHPWT